MKKSPHILIVDDDPMMRLMSREALAAAGFDVCEAQDGQHAMTQIATRSPDLILLDVTMPIQDGFSVCKQLRSMDVTKHIPVVMLTSLDDVESIGNAYEAGATDFILKPINWHILVQRVHSVLRASDAFSELRTSQSRLMHAQRIAQLGNWEWDLESDTIHASDEGAAYSASRLACR